MPNPWLRLGSAPDLAQIQGLDSSFRRPVDPGGPGPAHRSSEPEGRRSHAPEKAALGARSLTQHRANKRTSNRKCVRRQVPYQTEARERSRAAGFSIAGAGFEAATFGL